MFYAQSGGVARALAVPVRYYEVMVNFRRLFGGGSTQRGCAPLFVTPTEVIGDETAAVRTVDLPDLWAERRSLSPADRERADILTEASDAVHRAIKEDDHRAQLRICKGAISSLDSIPGEPTAGRVRTSLGELISYEQRLMCESATRL